jgi:hypothetical protein
MPRSQGGACVVEYSRTAQANPLSAQPAATETRVGGKNCGTCPYCSCARQGAYLQGSGTDADGYVSVNEITLHYARATALNLCASPQPRTVRVTLIQGPRAALVPGMRTGCTSFVYTVVSCLTRASPPIRLRPRATLITV